MAAPINYFRQLGFEQPTLSGSINMFNQIQDRQLQNQNMQMAVSDDVARRGMEQQQQQRQAITFRDAQEQALALRGQQEIYSALNANDIDGAEAAIMKYKDKIVENGGPEALQRALQMIRTPDGAQMLKQKTLDMIQMAAGPENMAKFTAQQARPQSTQADPAKVLEFRKWLELNPNATPEEKRQIFNQMVVPQERAFATGTGAGQAKIATEQQLIPIEGEKAGAVEQSKVSAKTTEERDQSYLQAGVDAASALPNLMRSLDLLDQVKTGGFNKVATSARRLFGVEGADEAELSANLGRAVLAQLKPIFGAAFTAAEGDRLVAIEAGFGKSTEGNKRLLRELIDTNLRAANRALSIAKNKGDTTSAEILQNTIDQIKAFKSGDRDMLKSDWFLGDDEAPAPAKTSVDDLLLKYGG